MSSYYKCTIAYDGTAYVGWQSQPGGGSVEQVLISAFHKAFNKPIAMHGASRTDAGVHAVGQVALCITPIELDPVRLQYAWNNRLPPDVMIQSIDIVDSSFHPRCNVKQKTYHYYLFERTTLPFSYRYGWVRPYFFDTTALEDAFKIFVGTHDFRSFCTGTSYTAGTIRKIDDIRVKRMYDNNRIEITFVAQRFMRYMIRRLVGAVVTIFTRPHVTIESVKAILMAQNPAHSLPTAPACGLFLSKITYNQKDLNGLYT